MAQFANNRGNVLNDHERVESARKCLRILDESPNKRKWKHADLEFFFAEQKAAKFLRYECDEAKLQRLRDMVELYVTS